MIFVVFHILLTVSILLGAEPCNC